MCLLADMVFGTGDAETRDGKDGDGRGREGKDWKAKKRAFSRAHAMCIHLNLLAVGATVWYGFRLSSRMKLVGS